ncbi:MAG: zf-HC2 domain-containing protein [bacterium]|nr:zf-HC2 domain-containing protein [bacterium]
MSNHDFIACVNPTIGAKLLSYGLGNLPEEEKNEFEEHLLLCPACQSELKAAGQMLKAMSVGKGELARKLQGEPERKESPGITPRVYLWPIVAAAACLIGLIYWAAQPSRDNRPISSVQVLADTHDIATDRLDTATLVRVDSMKVDSVSQSKRFAALATKLPLAYIMLNPRGQAANNRENFELAMRDYQDKNYRAAAEQLRKLAQSDSVDTEQLLYWGVSAYMTGNTSEAIRVFDRTEKLKPRTTRLAQVRWYRANAKLVAGDLTGAKRDLQLVAGSEADLSRDAKELLTKLQ